MCFKKSLCQLLKQIRSFLYLELVAPAVYRDETYDEFVLAVAQKDVPHDVPYRSC